jgi:NAD(P)H-flavin reductase
MKIYQIYVPDLNTYVKYKVLEPEQIDKFVSELNVKTEKDRRRKILQHVIFNLKTEVSSALGLMTRSDAERCIEALYTRMRNAKSGFRYRLLDRNCLHKY